MSPRLHAGAVRVFALAFLGLTFGQFTPGANAQTATPQPDPDRGAAYYHYTLSRMYGEMAASNARQDYATQAIEDYKLAIGADPDSRMLQDGLPDLYFMLGRIREAVATAQEQVAKHSDDSHAHQLLGRVYL